LGKTWEQAPTAFEAAQLIKPPALRGVSDYLHYTYRRLAEENKIAVSDDGKYIAFNTGLVTPNQEPVFALSDHNHLEGAEQPWHFQNWCRRGEYDMTSFSQLPEMAHYFDDPSALVFDGRKELRCNIEHILDCAY